MMLRNRCGSRPIALILFIILSCTLYIIATNKTVFQQWSTSFQRESSLQASDPSQPAFPAEFPKHIWQTSSPSALTAWAEQIQTWINLNPEHEHLYLTDKDLNNTVHDLFQDHQSTIAAWESITDVILRADFFRYLILLAKGGVYSDIDTTCLAPINEWVPLDLEEQANAVIGIEYNGEAGDWAIHPISFSQWTLMSKPNHPLFTMLVSRVIGNLELLTRRHHTTLPNLRLEFDEVLAATGPGLITDVVMHTIRERTGDASFGFGDLANVQEPTLFGDLLVLPINGFAGGQAHSHSGDLEWGRELVRHHFDRSWYYYAQNEDGDLVQARPWEAETDDKEEEKD